MVWRKGKFIQTDFHIWNGTIRFGRLDPVMPAAYVIPPFTDPHIHGGWGWDIRRGDFHQLERCLVREGIFCAVPTLDNDSFENLHRIASRFFDYRRSRPGGIFPFLRVEGPFISPFKKGFQKNEWIQKITPESLHRFFDIPALGMFTFAPELEGTEALLEKAMWEGIIPSVGHSRATYQEFLQVHQKGVKHITHYPNALSECHHREIGLTGAGLLLNDLQLEVIADGIHTCPEFLALLHKIKGPSFALVSDMIPPAFSHQDRFDGRRLVIKGSKISTGEGILAGGATPISKQVAQLHQLGWTPESLVPPACENARVFLGLTPPALEEGRPADFLVLDQKMNLKAVFKQGRLISEAE